MFLNELKLEMSRIYNIICLSLFIIRRICIFASL
jgi:hypothetical protein